MNKELQMKSDYTSSIKFDNRLYKQDIFGSIAHVNMLAKQNKKNRMITMTHNKKLINYYIRNFKAEIFKEIKLFKQNYYLIKWKL